MDNSILRQLQLTQLEILKVFDAFCRKHDLKYSLYAGSLLGAVRHKGFIPWDDDLDVCMAREEYDRFLALWVQNPTQGYILQNKENSKYFDQSFSKLRKDHTTFLENDWQIGNHHTGIFLDIFPIDRIPNGRINRAIFRWRCMKYQLLTREFAPPEAHPFVKLGSKLILALIPTAHRQDVRLRTIAGITKYNTQHNLDLIGIEAMSALRKTPLPPEMFNSFVRLPFEDSSFMCFAKWDTALRQHFGNYMQLPPEEERTWKHHPILIDFERNFEEITTG